MFQGWFFPINFFSLVIGLTDSAQPTTPVGGHGHPSLKEFPDFGERMLEILRRKENRLAAPNYLESLKFIYSKTGLDLETLRNENNTHALKIFSGWAKKKRSKRTRGS